MRALLLGPLTGASGETDAAADPDTVTRPSIGPRTGAGKPHFPVMAPIKIKTFHLNQIKSVIIRLTNSHTKQRTNAGILRNSFATPVFPYNFSHALTHVCDLLVRLVARCLRPLRARGQFVQRKLGTTRFFVGFYKTLAQRACCEPFVPRFPRITQWHCFAHILTLPLCRRARQRLYTRLTFNCF